MSMVPNLTFEVKPILVWKQYAKGHDFASHYLPYGVQVTATFRKICHPSRMPSFSSIPNSIEANAQAWFSSSFIHDSKLIIEVLSKQAKKNHPTGQIGTIQSIRPDCSGHALQRTLKPSGITWKDADSRPVSSPSISRATSTPRRLACTT